MQSASEDDIVWKVLLCNLNKDVLQKLFDEEPPLPQHGHTWKRHFFEFERNWLNLARSRTGRLLIRMNTVCAMAEDWPHYGVPWHFVQAKCACRGIVCRGIQHTYGVYDVTEFAPHHPGSSAMLDLAIQSFDSTDLFDSISHSQHARRLLSEMIVPGLDAIPYCDASLPLRLPKSGNERFWELFYRLADWLCGLVTAVLHSCTKKKLLKSIARTARWQHGLVAAWGCIQIASHIRFSSRG